MNEKLDTYVYDLVQDTYELKDGNFQRLYIIGTTNDSRTT